MAINPSSPTVNDDLTADINTTSCVDVSTNDWRLGGTSIAIRNIHLIETEIITIFIHILIMELLLTLLIGFHW